MQYILNLEIQSNSLTYTIHHITCGLPAGWGSKVKSIENPLSHIPRFGGDMKSRFSQILKKTLIHMHYHIYTVYIRYFQESYQRYSHTWCKSTVLANPNLIPRFTCIMDVESERLPPFRAACAAIIIFRQR